MKNKRIRLYLGLNILIAVLEVIGLSMAIANRRETVFQYYTQLSNLFLLIASVINIYFCARVLSGKRKKYPRFANIITYSAVCTTTVTLLVVLFVLSWMVGDLGWLLTSGAMLYTHTLCPILGIAAFCSLSSEKLTKHDSVIALTPTIAYAIVAIIMNITHAWYGPYPFLLVYEQPIWASIAWVIGILGGAYAITVLVRGMTNRGTKKR